MPTRQALDGFHSDDHDGTVIELDEVNGRAIVTDSKGRAHSVSLANIQIDKRTSAVPVFPMARETGARV